MKTGGISNEIFGKRELGKREENGEKSIPFCIFIPFPGFFHSQIQNFHSNRALDRDCDHCHSRRNAPACLEQGEVKGADNKLHKQSEAIKHGICDVFQ